MKKIRKVGLAVAIMFAVMMGSITSVSADSTSTVYDPITVTTSPTIVHRGTRHIGSDYYQQRVSVSSFNTHSGYKTYATTASGNSCSNTMTMDQVGLYTVYCKLGLGQAIHVKNRTDSGTFGFKGVVYT